MSPSRSDCCPLPTVLGLLALTGLALGLRLLGHGLESIWYDEAVSLILSGTDATVDLTVWRQHDVGNPPGYFLLLRAWLWLWSDRSVETARALSAVAGALSVPATWALARAVAAPRRAAWLACLLVAVSPPLVYLAQDARVFALFATVTTLACAAVARIRQTDGTVAWVAFAICGAILILLHYYAFFVLVALGLALLVWAWPRGWRPVFKLAACSAFVALAFSPWLPMFLWQKSQGATRSPENWWQHLALLPLTSVTGRTLVWKEDGAGALAAVGLFALAGLYLPALWLLRRERPWPRPLLWLLIGVPLLVITAALLGTPMIHFRYLSALFPALMLVLAWALCAGFARRSWLTLLPVLALAALVPPALGRVYLVRHKPDWRGAAAHIERKGGDLPVYLYEDHGTSEPFAYYRPGQPHRCLGVPFGTSGQRWDEAGYVADMRRDRAGFWLVLFLTVPETKAELPHIRQWAGEGWEVEVDESCPPLCLLRCRPRTPAARVFYTDREGRGP
jgi:uncharacterized membrane protein